MLCYFFNQGQPLQKKKEEWWNITYFLQPLFCPPTVEKTDFYWIHMFTCAYCFCFSIRWKKNRIVNRITVASLLFWWTLGGFCFVFCPPGIQRPWKTKPKVHRVWQLPSMRKAGFSDPLTSLGCHLYLVLDL